MWVILLDRSSSMAEPFSQEGQAASSETKGRIRTSEAATKWEAATRAVQTEAASLSGDETICLIAFNHKADVVFEGKAAEHERLAAKLGDLRPEGRTDLAAGLRRAYERAGSSSVGGPISVEVISDGLTDEAAAREAAALLARRAGLIDVILIDPTLQGQAVAKAVAIGGRVTAVVSSGELRAEGREAARRHADTIARFETAMARADAERQATVAGVPAGERLEFTVGYAGRPLVDTWSPLSVFLHLDRADLEAELRRRLVDVSWRAGQSVTTTRTAVFANRGTWLRITPRIDNVEFNPRCHEIAWYEDLQEAPFRFRVVSEHAGRVLAGLIEVTTATGLPLCDLAVSVRSRSASDPELPEDGDGLSTVSAPMYQQVFASYAHVDRDVVVACAAAYKALGVHLNIDRNDLTVGLEWHPALLGLIDRSDVFQLYWSNASKASPWVQREWEYALQRRGLKGMRFVRGVYWDEPMPVPDGPLGAINFGYLDLEALGPERGKPRAGSGTAPLERMVTPPGADDPSEVTAEWVSLRAPAVQAAVIPLLPGETRQHLAALRRDLQSAVVLLEGATGLRYYPVPTLVVDDYVVHEVRAVQSVPDDVPQPPDPAPETLAHARRELGIWRRVLQALTLEFHTRHVPPLAQPAQGADFGTAEVDPFATGLGGVSGAALHGLKEFGEWGIMIWTDQYFVDPWDPGTGASEPDDPPTAPNIRRALSEVVLEELNRLVDELDRDGPARYQGTSARTFKLSRSTSCDPSAFDYRRAWEALEGDSAWHELTVLRVPTKFLGGGRPWSPREDWSFEIKGTAAAFARAVVHCRDRLAVLLPRCEARSYRDAGLPTDAMNIIGYAVLAKCLVEELKDFLPCDPGKFVMEASKGFDRWVVDALYPSWQRSRDYLAHWGIATMTPNLTFLEFLAAYLDQMLSLFSYGNQMAPDFVYKSSYKLTDAAAREIAHHDADLRLTLKPHDSFTGLAQQGRQDFSLHGRFSEFVNLFRRAADRMLLALKDILPRTEGRGRRGALVHAAFEAATFGIFAPQAATDVDDRLAEWAVRNHLMPQATLPGTPRVLFCARTIAAANADHGRDGLVGPDPFLFRFAVLVHEHFHAAVETGAAPGGPPMRAAPHGDDTAAGRPVNESLAVWMELHALRQLGDSLATPEQAAAVQAAIWAYARSGKYPAWPYAGADRVEALYRREGLLGVRRLIHRLRTDPGAARREFDALSLSNA